MLKWKYLWTKLNIKLSYVWYCRIRCNGYYVLEDNMPLLQRTMLVNICHLGKHLPRNLIAFLFINVRLRAFIINTIPCIMNIPILCDYITYQLKSNYNQLFVSNPNNMKDVHCITTFISKAYLLDGWKNCMILVIAIIHGLESITL